MFLQIQSRRRITLDADMPVVAVNDWMPVVDLKTGAEKGQLRVTLAAGTERQIGSLVMPGWRPENRKSLEEDEHLYDSVHESGDEDAEGDSSGGEGGEVRRVENGEEEHLGDIYPQALQEPHPLPSGKR